MSLIAYKLLHLLGVFMVLTGIGAMAFHAAAGGAATARKAAMILHGVGMVILLVAGFGALARLGAGFPGWVWAKLVLWLLLGGAVMVPYRRPELARLLFWLVPILGAVGGWLALAKPF